MAKPWLSYTGVTVMLAWSTAQADPKPASCPRPVGAAVARALPGATIAACKPEREHGQDRFEVRVVKPDGGRLELDVAPDGKILQIEEPIAVDQLPAAVRKAFAARYPRARIERAEKQTPTGGAPSYELAFRVGDTRKEATFRGDGAFVEQE